MHVTKMADHDQRLLHAQPIYIVSYPDHPRRVDETAAPYIARPYHMSIYMRACMCCHMHAGIYIRILIILISYIHS